MTDINAMREQLKKFAQKKSTKESGIELKQSHWIQLCFMSIQCEKNYEKGGKGNIVLPYFNEDVELFGYRFPTGENFGILNLYIIKNEKKTYTKQYQNWLTEGWTLEKGGTYKDGDNEIVVEEDTVLKTKNDDPWGRQQKYHYALPDDKLAKLEETGNLTIETGQAHFVYALIEYESFGAKKDEPNLVIKDIFETEEEFLLAKNGGEVGFAKKPKFDIGKWKIDELEKYVKEQNNIGRLESMASKLGIELSESFATQVAEWLGEEKEIDSPSPVWPNKYKALAGIK